MPPRGEPNRGDYQQIGQKDKEVDEFARNHLLGTKTLGFFSSIVIVVNNIAGPGMLVLPAVYQEAGWVVPTVVLVLISVGSGFAATFLVDTMARVPENGHFQRRIEFVNIFEEFWGVKGMYIAQVLRLPACPCVCRQRHAGSQARRREQGTNLTGACACGGLVWLSGQCS